MENKENKSNLRGERLDKLLNSELSKNKEKEEDLRKAAMDEISEFICSNKWCKAKFKMQKYKWYEDNIKTCPKCRSFDNELSAGTTFEKKEYAGDRHDKSPHQTDFKFSDYLKGKWGKFWEK